MYFFRSLSLSCSKVSTWKGFALFLSSTCSLSYLFLAIAASIYFPCELQQSSLKCLFLNFDEGLFPKRPVSSYLQGACLSGCERMLLALDTKESSWILFSLIIVASLAFFFSSCSAKGSACSLQSTRLLNASLVFCINCPMLEKFLKIFMMAHNSNNYKDCIVLIQGAIYKRISFTLVHFIVIMLLYCHKQ